MKVFFILAMVLSSFFSTAQSQKYQMNIPWLACGKTTEEGEDEVYLLITWRTSTGTTGNIRLPFDNHFNINDRENITKPNTGTRIILKTILDFDLADNQHIDIFCSVMEEDDGTAVQYNSAGVKILRIANANNGDIFNSITSNVFKKILDNVASTNHLNNSDDWIGSFSYRISKSNGVLKINLKRIDNSNSNGGQTENVNSAPPSTAKTQPVNVTNANVLFAFTGDGSKYDASVTITTAK